MKEISAGIIIYRKTEEGLKFLILYHGHDYWNFPKGKIESEERSFQTALREVREETGLSRNDLRFSDHFRTYERFNFWRRIENKNVKIFKVVIFYLAESGKSQIKLSDEHEGYSWFTYKEALKNLAKHKDSQRVLTEAYNFLQAKQKLLKKQHIRHGRFDARRSDKGYVRFDKKENGILKVNNETSR